MYFLIGIVMLAAAIAFAFGEQVARTFVAAVLCVGALAILAFIGWVAIDLQTYNAAKAPAMQQFKFDSYLSPECYSHQVNRIADVQSDGTCWVTVWGPGK